MVSTASANSKVQGTESYLHDPLINDGKAFV